MEPEDEISEELDTFSKLYHNNKVIGNIKSYSENGQRDDQPMYSFQGEITDKKAAELLEGKHYIVAQEGKLTLVIP